MGLQFQPFRFIIIFTQLKHCFVQIFHTNSTRRNSHFRTLFLIVLLEYDWSRGSGYIFYFHQLHNLHISSSILCITLDEREHYIYTLVIFPLLHTIEALIVEYSIQQHWHFTSRNFNIHSRYRRRLSIASDQQIAYTKYSRFRSQGILQNSDALSFQVCSLLVPS